MAVGGLGRGDIEASFVLEDKATAPLKQIDAASKRTTDNMERGAKKAGQAWKGFITPLIGVGAIVQELSRTIDAAMEDWNVKLSKMEFAVFSLGRLFGLISEKDAGFITNKKALEGLAVEMRSADEVLTKFFRLWLKMEDVIKPSREQMSDMGIAVEKLRLEMEIDEPFKNLLTYLSIAKDRGELTTDQFTKLAAALGKVKEQKIDEAFEVIVTPSFAQSMMLFMEQWREMEEMAERLPTNFQIGWREGIRVIETAREFGATVSSAIQDSLSAVFDALIIEGERLDQILKSILSNIARLLLNQASGLFTQGIGAAFSAKGNVFNAGEMVPFARGGVISSPVVFPMKRGIGIAGEAGPEAIMPLRRGRDGLLGVNANGAGGGSQITLNITAFDGPSMEAWWRRHEDRILAIVSQAAQTRRKFRMSLQ